MAWSLDLRRDLRRLPDDALADRFEQVLAARESLGLPGILNAPAFRRGPLHHPRVYRLLAAAEGLGAPTGTALDLLLVPLAAALGARVLLTRPAARAHLLNCEIQDLRDEIARRVAARRGRNP